MNSNKTHKALVGKFFGPTAMASALAVGVGGLASSIADAGGVSHYSIQDWVAAQGSEYDVDEDGTWEPSLFTGFDSDGNPIQTGGDLYVPPANNYIGWIAPATNHFGSVDYAGVAAKYLKDNCGVDLGTTFNGSVTAREAGDGQVLVTVRLQTRNALAWGGDTTLDLNADGNVDSGDWDFARQPLHFGARVADVCQGTAPSLGNVEANFEYYVDSGTNPLVDIGTFNYRFRKIMFPSSARGTLTGTATPARMTIGQTGIYTPPKKGCDGCDAFPVEFVKFQPPVGDEKQAR